MPHRARARLVLSLSVAARGIEKKRRMLTWFGWCLVIVSQHQTQRPILIDVRTISFADSNDCRCSPSGRIKKCMTCIAVLCSSARGIMPIYELAIQNCSPNYIISQTDSMEQANCFQQTARYRAAELPRATADQLSAGSSSSSSRAGCAWILWETLMTTTAATASWRGLVRCVTARGGGVISESGRHCRSGKQVATYMHVVHKAAWPATFAAATLCDPGAFFCGLVQHRS